MKTVKKAQSGAKANKFKNLGGEIGNPPFSGQGGKAYDIEKKKMVMTKKKAKNGGSYAAAGKSTGHTGSGMLAPTPKNITRTKKQAKFKDGGSMKKCKGGC